MQLLEVGPKAAPFESAFVLAVRHCSFPISYIAFRSSFGVFLSPDGGAGKCVFAGSNSPSLLSHVSTNLEKSLDFIICSGMGYTSAYSVAEIHDSGRDNVAYFVTMC
jgi:hypothetical protein